MTYDYHPTEAPSHAGPPFGSIVWVWHGATGHLGHVVGFDFSRDLVEVRDGRKITRHPYDKVVEVAL